MNTPSKKEIIRLKIGKARNTLNRLYYACFYAATALSFSRDIFTKTHSGVQQILGLHFINTGILEKELGKFYAELLNYRQQSDYDDFTIIDHEMVKEFSLLANKFVSSV